MSEHMMSDAERAEAIDQDVIPIMFVEGAHRLDATLMTQTGKVICHPIGVVDARIIARAVNSYDRMAEALRFVERWCDSMSQVSNNNPTSRTDVAGAFCDAVLPRIRAAMDPTTKHEEPQ